MMNFKNKSAGFSLIEVLVALAIMSIVMSVILISLSQGVRTIGNRFDRLIVFMRSRQLLIEASVGLYEVKADKPFEKKFEDPTLTCIYTNTPIGKNSSLVPMTHLQIAQVSAETSGVSRPIRDSVAVLVFRPEPAKEKPA